MESREYHFYHPEAQRGAKAPLTPEQERNILGSEIMHLRSITQYENRLLNLTRDNCRLQTEVQHLQYLRSLEKQTTDKQIQKLTAELLALKHLKPLATPPDEQPKCEIANTSNREM
ncbi:hypothetical protein E5D57_010960 [Metarhizium anisopliae]|nr:hypothetical protein E5D57_010960 [Metarhizium anisopliae]